MKKLTAQILLVCIFALSAVGLVSCNDAPSVPAATTPVVITPDNGTPNTSENSETPENPETPAAPNEIKNVILIIGDGMGLDHIAAGQALYKKQYSFTNWQFTNSNTDSVNSSGIISGTTDSAAGGTALATGKLTQNYYVGKDHTGADVPTILDLAKSLNKSTGVLTTDTLYGATPAAFSAHNVNRNNTSEIVASQILSGVDLLCGHKDSACTSQKRAIEAKGYAYCDDFANVDTTMTASMAYWQFDLATSSAKVALKDATVKALNFLDRDEDGFALMIEQAHIDKYSHNKDIVGTSWAVNSLNDTVEAILTWLGDRTDTAIVITSDHETGGLSVSTKSIYSASARSRVANADGSRDLLYYKYSSSDHTNAKVGVFVYGVTVDFSKLSDYKADRTIKNRNVYDLLADVLRHPVEYGKAA